MVFLAPEPALDLISLLAGAIHQKVILLGGKLLNGGIQRKAVPLANSGKQRTIPAFLFQRFEPVDGDGSAAQGEFFIGNEPVDGDALHFPQPRTMRTGADGIVEREHTRLQLAEGNAVLLAGIGLRKLQFLRLPFSFTGCRLHNEMSVGNGKRVFHRIGKARLHSLAQNQAVHNNFNVVFLVFIQHDLLGKVIEVSVHPDANIAAFFCVGKHFFVHTFLRADDGGEDDKTRTLRQGKDAVNDLIGGLLTDLLAANRAMRNADARIEQSEIIVNLGDRSHRGTRVFGGGFLVDGNGGGKPLDGINVGFIQLPQKHARIGRKRLHKAAVPLGIKGIERERGFARPGKPGEDNELIPRDIQVDIFEIMHPRAADLNHFRHFDIAPDKRK